MTLYACPWCDFVDYRDSDDLDEDGEDIVYDICADCLFELGWYFVLDKVEIFEFFREIDQFSPWETSFSNDFCEVN